MAKVVGQARAKQRGYYPLPTGSCRFVEEGDIFDLVEGQTKGKWFEVLSAEPDKKAGKPADKPASD